MNFLRVLGVALAAILMSGTAAEAAESFPSRPVRIVTAPAGGPNDFLARMIAPGLGDGLGQQVIVENRPAGVIPGQVVATSQPDGHTLLSSTGTLWILPLMQQAPFDAVKDFAPITQALTYPSVLVVSPSGPGSVKELIALAKAKPGSLNYSSGSSGSNTHLTAELFNALAGANIVRVPYKGEGPALIGLLAGEAQLMFGSGIVVLSNVKAGKLKVLGVTTAQPSPLYPGVRTLAESGVPGFESSTNLGIFVRAGTPGALIKRLHDDIVAILRRPDMKEKFFQGGYIVVGSSPDQFAALIKADIVKWSKLVKAARIDVR